MDKNREIRVVDANGSTVLWYTSKKKTVVGLVGELKRTSFAIQAGWKLVVTEVVDL
jgi:hypothetical protein